MTGALLVGIGGAAGSILRYLVSVAAHAAFGTGFPWGTLAVNAISSVTVLPTHRRRRLLRRWMTQELERAPAAGTAVSILIASEAPIYRRFGFGMAATACTEPSGSWIG